MNRLASHLSFDFAGRSPSREELPDRQAHRLDKCFHGYKYSLYTVVPAVDNVEHPKIKTSIMRQMTCPVNGYRIYVGSLPKTRLRATVIHIRTSGGSHPPA